MNGRLYDPYVGRFLSPDNNLQAPGLAQNYNRYSYCLNNPLRFTDPSGEFFAIPATIFFTLCDWGLGGSSLKTAYNTSKNFVNDASNAIKFNIYSKGNTSITTGFDMVNINLYLNVNQKVGNATITGGAGLNLFGFYANAGGTVDVGKWQLSGGWAAGDNYSAYGGSIKYDGYGAGYYYTRYGDAKVLDGIPNNQDVGGLSVYWPNGSFRFENDALARNNQDKWRSWGSELQIGDFVMGSHICTNAPDRSDKAVFDKQYRSQFWSLFGKGKNELGTYSDSKVFSSPFYIGVRMGTSVSKIGWDNPLIQDIFQNGWHLYATPSPLFYTPYSGYNKIYLYGGVYKSYSLFDR